MGKRELLLIAAFVLVGVVVYQATAPPADPSRRTWSVGGLINELRREVRGNQASAEAQSTTTIPAAEPVRELRLVVGSVELKILGEERDDIEAALLVSSNAFDAAEAERTAKATRLKVDEAGAVVSMSIDFPREGRQRAALTLKVPARLELRIEKGGSTQISNVETLMITGRGETTVSNIKGSVTATQRGNSLTLSNVGTLRLNTFSGAEAKISNVRGDATLSLQSGEVLASAIEGTVDIEARNCDLTLEGMEKVRKPIRINAINGEVVIRGVQTELRVDGRDTEIRVEQSAPAPIAIYNTGDEGVELALPADGGYKLDAMTLDGRLTVDPSLEKLGVKVAASTAEGGDSGDARDEQRVAAVVRGGGPLVTLRARGGDIALRLATKNGER
jgi:hypothetical protein